MDKENQKDKEFNPNSVEDNKSTKPNGNKEPRDKNKKDNKKSGNKNNRSSKGSGIPKRNDWGWYAASEQIAKDIASIPFNYMGGTNFPIKAKAGAARLAPTTLQRAIPSIMSIGYINSIGAAGSGVNNGINMAATQLYTFIRHANSGARNYEAADVMMYILAMRDIYSAYFEAKRIIGCAGLYNYYNHNYPDLLLKSMGCDPVDLRQNLAQYRGQLNLIAKKINSFAVPKYFKAFDRSAYIASMLFADSSSIRSQLYQFVRLGSYTWSGKTSTKGTELVTLV